MQQQLIPDILPRPLPSLDNFIVGQNAPLIATLRQCQAGRAIYLWGPTGSGRTHLLRAMAEDRPKSHYIAASDHRNLSRLLKEDQAPWQCIAIDDVDLLNAEGQAALFGLYNRWRELAGGPHAFLLLAAANRAPLAMPLREDLRTRLGWDLTFRVHLPSDQERAQALHQRAQDRGVVLGEAVVNWLLTHYTRDLGQLGALVDALDRYSLEQHRPITLPLLKQMLQSDRCVVHDKALK